LLEYNTFYSHLSTPNLRIKPNLNFLLLNQILPKYHEEIKSEIGEDLPSAFDLNDTSLQYDCGAGEQEERVVEERADRSNSM
jgi:hypothetical protein